jgi:hypothetical protein
MTNTLLNILVGNGFIGINFYEIFKIKIIASFIEFRRFCKVIVHSFFGNPKEDSNFGFIG